MEKAVSRGENVRDRGVLRREEALDDVCRNTMGDVQRRSSSANSISSPEEDVLFAAILLSSETSGSGTHGSS